LGRGEGADSVPQTDALSRVHFTEAAEADIQQAFEYFEARSAGSGAEFMERVEEITTRLQTNPHQYQTVFSDVHRADIRKFRMGLWYRIAGNTVVIACISHRRDLSLARRRAMRPVEPD